MTVTAVLGCGVALGVDELAVVGGHVSRQKGMVDAEMVFVLGGNLLAVGGARCIRRCRCGGGRVLLRRSVRACTYGRWSREANRNRNRCEDQQGGLLVGEQAIQHWETSKLFGETVDYLAEVITPQGALSAVLVVGIFLHQKDEARPLAGMDLIAREA